MTTPTTHPSLADFLLAQLDAEARIAETFVGEGPWQAWAAEDMSGPERDDEYAQLTIGAGRVLAQVAATRAVVELHARDDEGECAACGEGSYGCGPAGDPGYYRGADYPCPTLRALATAYADATGYRAEWSA